MLKRIQVVRSFFLNTQYPMPAMASQRKIAAATGGRLIQDNNCIEVTAAAIRIKRRIKAPARLLTDILECLWLISIVQGRIFSKFLFPVMDSSGRGRWIRIPAAHSQHAKNGTRQQK